MAERAPRAVVATAVAAALVTVLALGAVALVRFEREKASENAANTPPPTSETDAAAACGSSPCGVLTSLPVGGSTVELLADAAGKNGRLRILGPGSDAVIETALASMGVRLTQRSLACTQGPTSACLVRGGHQGGVVGEVFVARDDNWEPAERPYFSSAGYLDLLQVGGDGSPEVGVAEHPGCAGSAVECAGAAIAVQVFALNGTSAGCTPAYGALTQLPGWPDVELAEADLHECP